MPFSHDAFLDLFGAYNTRLWPAVVLLWAPTAIVAWAWWRQGVSRRAVFALLAVHWAWSGVVYHWLFFRQINPAAAIFAAAFVVQAGLFAWLGLTGTGRTAPPSGPRARVGGALVLYGLMYPFIGLAFGLEYPRLPLFAVPCPTTLITAGLLIAAVRVPRAAAVVPILWAAVGSTAALALGITADLALGVAGVLLVLDVAAPAVLGDRASA